MSETGRDPAPPGRADVSVSYHLRRERELNSLYSTARSLTALGELDEVLSSIVRHAHELIGTDFTYLSLVGPDGRLSVRASEGTISADFIAAAIPPGTGLGGRVITERTPLWVNNYLDAQQLHHDEAFDGLVAREGLVALLGVPLTVRGQAVGALFAADRSERSFTSAEIALFSAFADHAAIAFDNARLYDESRAALQELQAAYEVIEDQVATMEKAQMVHEALTHVVLTGGGPAEVATQLADQLGGTVSVLGRDSAPGASAGSDLDVHDRAGAAWPDIASALENARRTGRCIAEKTDSGLTHCVAAVQAGSNYLGALVWTQLGTPSPAELRTLERATHVVGLMVLKENALVDAAERLSGELMTELLVASPTVSADQRARTRARGIDVDELDLLVVVHSATVPTNELARRLHGYARERAGLAGEHLGRATMLLHATDPSAEVERVHAELRRQVGRPVLVIGERVRDRAWGRAFATAGRCADVAAALGKTDQGAMTDRYALYGLLFDGDRLNDLDRFLDDTIGALVAYDEQRTTNLVETATAYFDEHGNVARTARRLHLHTNTLLKRLERIAAILGDDWRAADALDVQLALRLHVLRAGTRIGRR